MEASAKIEERPSRRAQDPLLDSNDFSVEKLPSLGVVFEQFVTHLTTALAPLCRSAASLSVDKITTATLFDILGERRGSLAAVLHCADLDMRAAMIFDRAFIDAFAHSVFGGDVAGRREAPDRPLTKIDMALAERAGRLMGPALEAAFTGFAEASFAFERQELIGDVHLLGRRNMGMVALEVRFEAPGASGGLLAILPQAGLLPMRQKLMRDPAGDAPTVDPRWAKQMRAGVSSAQISVRGVLENLEMNLGDVSEFAVGQVLKLRGAGMGRVALECGGNDLFWCKLAQAEGRYTLEVEERIEQEQLGLPDAAVVG